MASFEIQGGYPLSGTLEPQGAKNEALQVISAVLLTMEKTVIHNVPDIRDVNNLMELLQMLGVRITAEGNGSFSFDASSVTPEAMLEYEVQQKAISLRGSIMIIGPLLARFGWGVIPRPGGDKIGRRRLDTHFLGFGKLGATFRYDTESGCFFVETQGLKGAYMLLDEASVTGTANIIMAAVLAEGTTTIYNAACEPYIQQLCILLKNMGADITGTGSNLLTIRGVSGLHGAEHTILPDMIEVGSFIGLAAMTGSDITIRNASVNHLGIIPRSFERLGVQMEIRGDDIHVPPQDKYAIETFIDGSIMTIADAPWPGLTPDLLSVFLVVATQAVGSVLIHQKMFESRLFFVDKLIDMGARIILCDPHRATVIGLGKENALRGTVLTSPDIRAGVALLIASLSARGKSVIHNIEQIDRGYAKIDVRLRAVGAHITREEE